MRTTSGPGGREVGGDGALEVALFAVVAGVATTIFALRWGLSFAAGDLIDTDGYMRFLRVADLMAGGDWFNPVLARSNYPFGEILHWTRPLDALLVALTWMLLPFLGDGALYGAAIALGPLTLIGLGWAMRWAFSSDLPASVRPLLLPGLLALPVVVGYFVPGRVDHHGLLMILTVLTVGATRRLFRREGSACLLGVILALGLWVSPEFLVPLGLTAVTLGLGVTLGRGDASYARVFGVAAPATAIALLVERGPGWMTVDQARISIVHVAVCAAAAGVFGLFARWADRAKTPGGRFALLAGLTLGAATAVIAAFPTILRGPFGEFHPLVRERWLFRVEELQPLYVLGWPDVIVHAGWSLLALAMLPALLRRKGSSADTTRIVGGWLVVYLGLAFVQVRWALYAQILALPILVAAIEPWYRRLEGRRLVPLIRPLLIAVLVGGFVALAPSLGGSAAPAEPRCDLKDVMPSLKDRMPTTVLAEQDVGPEILYRTRHNVVATPYGSEQAFLYTFAVMAQRDPTLVRTMLAEREVGLILVCPWRLDIMQPEEPTGTFYQALASGELPPFVEPVALGESTDYLLFTVDH